MGCLDDELLSDSLRPEVYSASIDLGVELAFGDSSSCILCFDKEILVESVRLVVTSSLGVELVFGDSSGCISYFDKEILI